MNKSELTPEQIAELKKEYPVTFDTLSEALPDDIIADGIQAFNGYSRDELCAMLLGRAAKEAIWAAAVSQIAGKAIDIAIDETDVLPDVFGGIRKKKNEA